MSQAKTTATYHAPSSQQMLLWSGLLFVAFGWIFWDFLQRQVLFAVKQQADWGHTLIIPFIAGYFVWLCRGRLLEHPFKRSLFGIVVLLIGLAWYTLCALGPTVLHHHNLMGFWCRCFPTGNSSVLLWLEINEVSLVSTCISHHFWTNNFRPTDGSSDI